MNFDYQDDLQSEGDSMMQNLLGKENSDGQFSMTNLIYEGTTGANSIK